MIFLKQFLKMFIFNVIIVCVLSTEHHNTRGSLALSCEMTLDNFAIFEGVKREKLASKEDDYEVEFLKKKEDHDVQLQRRVDFMLQHLGLLMNVPVYDTTKDKNGRDILTFTDDYKKRLRKLLQEGETTSLKNKENQEEKKEGEGETTSLKNKENQEEKKEGEGETTSLKNKENQEEKKEGEGETTSLKNKENQEEKKEGGPNTLIGFKWIENTELAASTKKLQDKVETNIVNKYLISFNKGEKGKVTHKTFCKKNIEDNYYGEFLMDIFEAKKESILNTILGYIKN